MDRSVRTWSIVVMGLLSAILIYVLVRTPPSVRGASPPPPEETHVHAGPATPEPPGPLQEHPEYYRGWPLFLGWPLPEVPSDWGTGGSGVDTPPSPPVPLRPDANHLRSTPGEMVR
ncbi:hypothetical protein JQX13_24160 [Archangium violaceum]|uniref:hypothetical protein n=1 Tax=Archangium violaceum TaxID=83451 RepID=UPI00193B3B78|nr:hypothetical protein [Archangium violaceum]QRK12853.1 hypothetical protein JQX13_24160 [Archangium violaceum]